MVTLTHKAIQAVNRFIEGSGGSAQGLRIQVSGGGGSGFQYGMKLEPAAEADDTVIECDQVKIFIDVASLPIISGATVDFVESLEGSGFKFINPNAKSACACDNSFAC